MAVIGSTRSRMNKLLVRYASTSLAARTVTVGRTPISDPREHTIDHKGLFYTLPEDIKSTLFTHGGLPRPFAENSKTFGETAIMIRPPALYLIDCLKRADYSALPIRYVLYGKPGCGKSITLAHVLHYAHLSGFIILHIPWVWNWMRSNRCEVVASASRPGLFDLPIVASNWLKHFSTQNNSLLANQDLVRCSKDYVWNQRESTPAGSSLSELVGHGINRVKYAADVIDALLFEITSAASQNKVKTLIAIDGFNGFFAETSQLKAEDRTRVKPDKVSMVQSFFSALVPTWKNGAIIVSVDQICGPADSNKYHYPMSLLGRKGFEMLDPFIPIRLSELTESETEAMLDYYEDRNWLSRSINSQGRQELAFLSNKNPYQLMNLCNSV